VRLVRRLGFAFAALLLLSVFGTGSIFSLLLGHRGGFVFWPFLWLFWPFLIFLFFTAMRRFAMPLGDVVEAADRVATGDYTARVSEHGPSSLRTVGRAFNSMAARLESQDRQRRHLMADIAHELRTPLSVIQGRLEGVLDGVYPQDEAQLRQVLDDARMLSRLVDDLRTLAHAEGGTLTLQKEPTDLGVLAHEVIETFSADASGGGVSLHLEASAELPLVAVDPLRIREVLMNLVSNALRHTPDGGSITIAIRADTRRLVVTVADTGIGMASEETARVFDRFYKGRTSQGSGLGLTIARNLVTAHGGEIGCESRPGTGTTFTFALPFNE
jgi:two-component system OmpR family sensor kinase/two-component system sensor histidine kinase BaeS